MASKARLCLRLGTPPRLEALRLVTAPFEMVEGSYRCFQVPAWLGELDVVVGMKPVGLDERLFRLLRGSFLTMTQFR